MADQGLVLHINGHSYTVLSGELPAGFTLSDYIRDKALLKGTKVMCGEGGCGACTVTVQSGDGVTQPVNSCLVPIHMCNGWNVMTIEGLGDFKTGYNKIQQTLADNNGSQCGFCSPGMVMTMYGAAHQSKDVTKDLEGKFDGNICRCTGYRPIMSAMHKCTVDIEDITKCLNCPNSPPRKVNSKQIECTTSDDVKWYIPASMAELKALISQNEKRKYYLAAGHTGVGVYKHDGPFDVYIDIKKIPELVAITQSTGQLTVGAAVSLTQLMDKFLELSSASPRFSYLKEAARYLEQVANQQVRNIGSWAGNLMMKCKHVDFVSDLFTLLECIGVQLNVYNCANDQKLTLSVAELLTNDLSGHVIESMVISEKPNWTLQTYKVMPRYRNAHSLLSVAFFVHVDDAMKITERPSLVYAGVGDNFVHAADVESLLVGKCLSEDSTVQACLTALEKVKFDDRDLLPSVNYRKTLTKSLFYKAVLSIIKPKPELLSGGEVLERPSLSSGEPTFQTDPAQYPLTEPLPKLDARKQTAGEAQYVGDMVCQLVAVFVKSTIGSGKITSIDFAAAVQSPGIIRVLTYKDIPGVNMVDKNEVLLCETEVNYYGQPVAIVVAETESQAMAARELIKVTYSDVKTPILTTQDAIKAKSFHPKPAKSGWDVLKGDAEGALKGCDFTVSGAVETGEQYPMHMETQTCLADPQEGSYVLHASTQSMTQMQANVAKLLGLSTNEVEVKVRRAGGGFGAKQTRSIYVGAAAALASYHAQRPVKMSLTIEDNMEIIGRRQPLRIEYRAGVNKDMKIQAIAGSIYENAGYNTNEAMSSIVLRWIDNAYYVPNWDIKAFMCKTNNPNHSYIRAPGIVSAMHFAEQIVDDLSSKFAVPPETFREANLYKQGQTTPYGELMSPCYVEEIWYQLKTSTDFQRRSAEIAKFNAANVWRKKALTLTPLKYGMAFWPSTNFMVHVSVNYADSSVTLIHAGVELGQGINTKAIQVASHTLGIPVDRIKCQPPSTWYNINSAQTGGSITSDMNCTGVERACQTILQKMAPYQEAGLSWDKVVEKCKKNQVDLHAKFFTTDKDIVPNQKGFKSYDIFGASSTEVELDVLTGNYIIHRMDVLYDCGASYSPDIDVGQIEGAIIMGLGMFLHEEVTYASSGQMITNNTWNYHVPMNRDIPVKLQVQLIGDKPNTGFPFRAKIVAEPPLILADSAVSALKQCITEFRKQQGNPGFFTADAPFTVEKVLLACNLNSSNFVVKG